MGQSRIVNEGILEDSNVYKVEKNGTVFLAFIWEEAYEERLLEEAGWTCTKTPMTLHDFFRSSGTKLLSSPYWACDCKIKFLKIRGVKSICLICGKQFPHQRKEYDSIKHFFGWDNVFMFRPREIPDAPDGDDDEGRLL